MEFQKYNMILIFALHLGFDKRKWKTPCMKYAVTFRGQNKLWQLYQTDVITGAMNVWSSSVSNYLKKGRLKILFHQHHICFVAGGCEIKRTCGMLENDREYAVWECERIFKFVSFIWRALFHCCKCTFYFEFSCSTADVDR